MPSGQSRPFRFTSLRAPLLLGVGFFAGIQFRVLSSLLRIDECDHPANAAAWTPHEYDTAPKATTGRAVGNTSPATTARESLKALMTHLSRCGGDTGIEGRNFWTYHFDCPATEPLFTNEHQFMLASGKTRGDMAPKVTIDSIGFPGQTLDFFVAQLFFLHPTPQTKGRYMEIGAYYGFQFTNTLFFEQYLGWNGWLFEPTNVCFDELVKNRPNDTHFQMGLCEQESIIEFGGFGRCKPRNSSCVPMTSIKDSWDQGFDFASIDVEGREMDVLKSIDLTRVPIKVLVIEWRRKNGREREEYLKQWGYVRAGTVYFKAWGIGDEIYYRPDLVDYFPFTVPINHTEEGSLPWEMLYLTDDETVATIPAASINGTVGRHLGGGGSGGRKMESQSDHPQLHENGITILPETLKHLSSLPSFPKIVHLSWPDKDVLNKSLEANSVLEQGPKNLKRLNPDWEIIVHDDDDIDRTIQNFRHPAVSMNCTLDLASAHIVEKTDMFRLMIVYERGGLYSDIDRVMNVNLSERIKPGTTKLVIPTYYDHGFAQDLFGSSPGNDIILNIIKRRCEKREKFPRRSGWLKGGDLMTLTYLHTATIEKELFGGEVRHKNESLWNETRHLLASHSDGTIVTKRDVWCDGFLVTDFPGCKGVSRESFYRAQNHTHWTKELNSVWKE